jgi:hypothetical protein
MEIETQELTTCEVAPDGCAISLGFVDSKGEPATIRLSVNQVGALVMTLPGLISKALQTRFGDHSLRHAYPLDSRVIEQSTDPKHGMMTFTTMAPDGNTLGAKGGSQVHTLTLAQLPTGITSVNAAQNITINTLPITLLPAPRRRSAGRPAVRPLSTTLPPCERSKRSKLYQRDLEQHERRRNNVQPAIACNYIIRII